jgi:DNA-binding FadR family transcriptional regulator
MSLAIFDCFRDAIESGCLQPKDRLPAERQVMRMFETPRGPVRKALKMLEDAGMVTRHVGSGTFVADTPTRAVAETVAGAVQVSPQDVIEARLAIEPGFAEFVVARATAEDFARMEAWLTRAEQAPDQRHFREAMYSFHLEIARATRNPLLATIFEIIIAIRARAGWEKLPHINETRASQRINTESGRRIMVAFHRFDSLDDVCRWLGMPGPPL